MKTVFVINESVSFHSMMYTFGKKNKRPASEIEMLFTMLT